MLFHTDAPSAAKASPRRSMTHLMVTTILRLLAANFNLRPSLRKYLRGDDGWIDFTIGIRTENDSIHTSVVFNEGHVFIASPCPDDVDVTLIFTDDKSVRKLLGATPTEQIFMLMKSELRTTGNAACMNLFFFYLSLLLNKKQRKLMRKDREHNERSLKAGSPEARTEHSDELLQRRAYRMPAQDRDPGVRWLQDPYLSAYSLTDFPRIEQFLDIHFKVKAEICPERPRLVTQWCRENGFEKDKDGNALIPELRQGRMLKHLMKSRQPIIRKNDLIAGTTTTKEIGVVVYPDSHGTMIWSELLTVPYRTLNPYDVDDETRDCLHHQVFPYWMHRNFKEWVRDEYDSPLCQAIDERFAVYFIWKQAALSHTIPDFPKILRLGTSGLIAEIEECLTKEEPHTRRHATLTGMIQGLEGLTAYSRNLAAQATAEAGAEKNPRRRKELEHLAGICERVVAHPARTLDEAVNAVWITWIGLHMENTNAGLSIGRLDQWLQPYFEADMQALPDDDARNAYVRHAIEMVACLFMRCTDHLPLTPDLANWYFGGSSSDQAITLGGVTPTGEDAVNDMTYIFLKVTEMLSIRDPNVNARFHPLKNSDTYLKRLCEVNLITAATPSLHNDEAIFASLAEFDYAQEDLNEWSATGCVEPTLSGKHIGHTNFQMMNKVAFFGSGSTEAVAMANRVAKFAHDAYGSHTNYRGGPYTCGFWSMSNNVIYGTLSGALPSGRLAGKPFTPGLTPEPCASRNLLDNIRDVAQLDPRNMNNNIAFNVKVVPRADASREQMVDEMFAYVKTYFSLGGMQMQMNVVTSETLRDAMAHPENYRNLIVRISGYNAYFVTLNRDMQMELIARAEYAL